MLDASLLDLQTAYRESCQNQMIKTVMITMVITITAITITAITITAITTTAITTMAITAAIIMPTTITTAVIKQILLLRPQKTGDITTFAPIALLLAASLSVIAFITKRRRSA